MDLAFERHPFSGGPWLKFMLKLKKKKKIIFFHSEKCKNLSFVCYAKKKAKPIGHDLPKALFRSVLLRELTEVEDLTGLQQERREKKCNWCGQAWKCSEGQHRLEDL